MNSRTSRPRSPTSAITFTSACAPRAIIPSSVLLPTPDGAKMPTRWPTPSVISPSITRTPVGNGVSISLRASGFGGSCWVDTQVAPVTGPRSSSGRPSPSSTRPNSASPTANTCSRPDGTTVVSGDRPATSPSGVSSVVCREKPTTSASSVGWFGVRSSQISPSRARMPVALRICPTA